MGATVSVAAVAELALITEASPNGCKCAMSHKPLKEFLVTSKLRDKKKLWLTLKLVLFEESI